MLVYNLYRIPYAAASRWQPPIDLAFDLFTDGSFDATSFGACCPQPDIGTYIPKQDERCLYLNVFTPLNESSRSLLPVLVWIHGGGLTTGCSSQSIPLLYNGTNIIKNSVQQSVIVVTINYRLGVFADMYLTELIEENSEWPTAGNYHYLDILSALRWVNVNIRDYGGNPNNVLLFGESSGGRATTDVGALRGSSNLYQHIISQSGPVTSSLFYSNRSSALEKSYKLVDRFNCSYHKEGLLLECLRNISMNDLITVYGNGPVKSIIDGYFFSNYPLLAIQRGTYNKNINMILGTNKHEEPFLPTFSDMNSELAVYLITEMLGKNRATVVIDHYQLNKCSSNTNDTNRCVDITGNLINTFFGCAIRRLYDTIHLDDEREEKKLFWYNMDCNPGVCPELPSEEASFCVHAAEIPFVFATESNYRSANPINCTWDDETRGYSNKIISHWINMAIKGEPLESWKKYHPLTPNYLQLTPYQNFSMELWDEDCTLFDNVELDDLYEMFDASN